MVFVLGTGRKGQLRKKLRASKTFEEWREAALALDKYLGFDEWKGIEDDPYYDWRLVRKVLKSMYTLRKSGDAWGVLGVLETCVKRNFAGVESQRSVSTISFARPYSVRINSQIGYIVRFVQFSFRPTNIAF